jgi:hypothetical protein
MALMFSGSESLHRINTTTNAKVSIQAIYIRFSICSADPITRSFFSETKRDCQLI